MCQPYRLVLHNLTIAALMFRTPLPYPIATKYRKMNAMTLNFTAYIEKDMESGMYVGTVPNLPGAHTFAETIDDLRDKLVEVISLCLEEMDQSEIATLPVFAGITQVEVALPCFFRHEKLKYQT